MAVKHGKEGGSKPWDGAFEQGTDKALEDFSASVDIDSALAEVDIRASRAHAAMLAATGIIGEDDLSALNKGLAAILEEIQSGQFAWLPEREDVHMNIEARLIELCGEAGKRLHTARSRNDQVATDLRLYLREQLLATALAIDAIQRALLAQAEQHTETMMPGHTHLQPAQPVVFAHHLLAWNEALGRDWQRLAGQLPRLNQMPLGAGALAGTGFAIEREDLARQLGFAAPCANSLDAVSDRDFAIEYCAGAAISMMHLSRMAEEMILWLNPRFGFIALPDSWCTGSSIMPQKRNPDALELIRGKTGHCYGALVSLLTMMKAQPLAYNRDMQEDKPALFACLRQWLACLRIMAGVIGAMQARPERMLEAFAGSHATATDLADYLVAKGIPFRSAHRITGQIVRHAIEEGLELPAVSLERLREFCPEIDEGVYARLSLEGSVKARSHIGGTAPEAVRKALRAAQAALDARQL